MATVTFDTSSFRRWQVMGEHAVTLNFSLPQIPNGIHTAFLEIPVGSYVEFKGRKYTLYNPSDFTKNANRNYEYTLKLYAYQELLYDRIFINEPDARQVFPRQARPEEFLEAVVRNMNHFDTGDWDGTEWQIGQCITSNVQQNIQFNGVSCMEALRLVAEAFKTEWEVNNKTISLKKVEYNRDAPLKLSYGQGNGFVPGIGRGNFDQSRPIHKLYVKGGERNIEFKTYGSQTLLLPKDTTIRFDGTYFQDETGYDSTLAREYQTSADGTNLVRVGVPQTSRREAFIELTEAYPKRVGTITKIAWIYDGAEYAEYDTAVAAAIVTGADAGSVFCDVFDTTIPDDLNYASMRIPGEQMVFVPQTGRLAGRELGVQQGENDASDGYNHSERRFKLITDSDYGGFIPDGRLAVGDTYALFGMKMPQTYIDNGERDLLKEAVRYKYENEELRFTFKGQMDGIWAQANWDAIEDKIVAGGYVNFTDPQFHPDGSLIRIAAIKEYLHEPYKPELELTNIVFGGGLRGELAEIPQQEVVIDEQQREITRLERRRWRDIQELRGKLGDVFTEFSESINPVSVASMQYIAGNKMGQFRFVTSRTSNTVDSRAPRIEYTPSTNTLVISGGSGGAAYIQHQTLGIDNIDGKSSSGTNGTSVRPASEYRSWTIPLKSFSLEKNKFYWIYARVSRNGTDGSFFVETTARTAFEEGNYYWLVVGGLNSEQDGTRSFAPLFGYTEILPGQITTGMIRSSDGFTYFDLSGGNLHVGDGVTYLDWDTIRKTLIIQNAGFQIGTEIALNPNGSGHLADGAINWDANGNLNVENATIQNSELTNVIVKGTFRSPFVMRGPADNSVISEKTDNTIIWAGDLPGGNLQLIWDVTQSGRLIRIAHARDSGGANSAGYTIASAGNGYFYEYGRKMSAIKIQGEIVELVGIGTDYAFYGWAVVGRLPINVGYRIEPAIGSQVGILMQGTVVGTSSAASINAYTHDGGSAIVTRLGTGYYRVSFPTDWQQTTSSYMVVVWGMGFNNGGSSPIKATLMGTSSTYFEVRTSDDASENDGGFGFQMVSMLR